MKDDQKREVVEFACDLFSSMVHAESTEHEELDPLLYSLEEHMEPERARILVQRSFTYAEAFVVAKDDYLKSIPEPKQPCNKEVFKAAFINSFKRSLSFAFKAMFVVVSALLLIKYLF